jgi:hypothetical protein
MKKFLMILTLMALMINSSFGATITDVKTDHWLYTTVNNLVTKDLIKVYPDNTIRLSETTSKIEVIAASYNVLKQLKLINESQMATIALKHKSNIEKLGVPMTHTIYGDMLYPLSYALENEIIVMDDIKKMFDASNKLLSVSKQDASMIIGKVLNSILKEKLNVIQSLKFTDKLSISMDALPYIDFLVNKGIINGNGDAQGKFNPTSTINREVLVILLNGLYKNVENVVIQNVEIDLSPNIDNNIYVSNVYSDQMLLETRQKDEINVYKMDGVKVSVKGVQSSLTALKTGDEIKLNIVSGVLTEVIKDNVFTTVKGNINLIKSVDSSLGYNAFIELKEGTNPANYIYIHDYTKVYKDGIEVSLKDITTGFIGRAEVSGKDAYKLYVFSPKATLTGILQSENSTVKGNVLSIKLDDSSYFYYQLDQNVVVSGNGEYKIGQVGVITFTNGVITGIEVKDLKNNDIGLIKEIHIAAESYVKIQSMDSKVRTYIINDQVEIFKNSLELENGVYDLRLNQMVRITLQGAITSKIYIEASQINMEFEATVKEVIPSTNMLRVQDSNGIFYYVTFDISTKYLASDYFLEDKVYLYGTKVSNEIFKANLIIKM